MQRFETIIRRFKSYKLKYLFIPVVLLAVAALVLRSGVFTKGHAQPSAASNATAVNVVTVQYANVTPSIQLTGSIEGKTSATISAKIAGKIAAVQVQEGQHVQAGEPLVQLEGAELANAVRNAQAAVTKAQVNLDLATADYNRYAKLCAAGAVSQQQLDTAAAKVASARADLTAATAGESDAEQQYGYGVITAPVDGVVANVTATIGQVVSPGAALMTVEDVGQVYAVVNVEQKDIGRIQPGQPATVTVDAYPGRTFSGAVDTINPAAGDGSRMFRTKVKIDNADGALRPGMFAKIQLATGAAAQVLTVPQTALVQNQGLYYVYVVQDNKAVRRQVEIGDVGNDAIQIKSGLQAGENVIVSNVSQLRDGQAVTPAN